MKRTSRKVNTKRDHRTLDNSLLEQRHSDSLPLIAVGQDPNLSQRAQGRIKRHVSRKDSSKTHIQRNTYDSDASPTYFPCPLSPLPFNYTDNTPAVATAWTGVEPAVNPPSILNSYRDKSMEKYSSMKNLSIPWLNDSDEEWSIKTTKRTLLRPIAPISP